jgi:hypothetical protein
MLAIGWQQVGVELTSEKREEFVRKFPLALRSRLVAARAGWIWRAFDLKPYRTGAFKLSIDQL